MSLTQLIDQFQSARRDADLAVIEGVQALKHAVRFGAEITSIITCDINMLEDLLDELAPDVKDVVFSEVKQVGEDTFSKLSPQPPRTKVIALAKRKAYKLADLEPSKPIVLVEDPRDLENIGAVIRVSAAADVAAVVITGPADIWHPAVIRGAAGLQYAVPVLKMNFSEVKHLKRELYALDPTGVAIDKSKIPANAILLFGTERHGISQQALKASDQIVRLPMKEGVSSLNLATSVAATLY